MFKKVTLLLLALIVAIPVLTGCGGGAKTIKIGLDVPMTGLVQRPVLSPGHSLPLHRRQVKMDRWGRVGSTPLDQQCSFSQKVGDKRVVLGAGTAG
jgi:hypothetical protein